MNPSNRRIPQEYIRLGVLMHTAIAGASIAAVIQLASRESVDQVLLLSILCFAVTIPTSVAMVFISQLFYPDGRRSSSANQMEIQKWPVLAYLVAVSEQLSFFGGFLLLFWSFHPAAGVLFIATSILAILTVAQVEKRLIRASTPSEE